MIWMFRIFSPFMYYHLSIPNVLIWAFVYHRVYIWKFVGITVLFHFIWRLIIGYVIPVCSFFVWMENRCYSELWIFPRHNDPGNGTMPLFDHMVASWHVFSYCRCNSFSELACKYAHCKYSVIFTGYVFNMQSLHLR